MNTANYPVRLNYYDGLFLQAKDFITEQSYGMQMLSLHNQYVHQAYGIASGLELSLISNSVRNTTGQYNQWVVNIKAGFAQCQVNGENGHPYCPGLLVPNDTHIDVPLEFTPNSSGDSFYVALTYETKTEDVDVDKGPDPIHILEQPKFVIFGQGDSKLNDKAYVLLGKITTGDSPPISYQQNHYIYDVNSVFNIAFNTPENIYTLGLRGSMSLSKSLSVGQTDSYTTPAAVKVAGGVLTDTLTAKSGITTQGQVNATGGVVTQGAISGNTITVNGSSLSVSDGTVTAKDVVVTNKLSLSKDFTVANQFTAAKGIIIDNGDMKITVGNISLAKGNADICGKVTCDSMTVNEDFTAAEAMAKFKGVTVSGPTQTNSAIVDTTLDVKGALTAGEALNVKGIASFESEIKANNLITDGYLTVSQNATVNNTLTAESLVVNQGLSVTQNITTKGNISASGAISSSGTLSAASLKLSGAFDSEDDIQANKLTSKNALVSQGGKVSRDVQTAQSWQAVKSLPIELTSITNAATQSNVMYRLVVEGCSNAGPVHSELSGRINKSAADQLVSTVQQDLGSGAKVSQGLSDGKLTLSVTPSSEDTFQWLGVSVSVWMFTES